jgi:tRNA threonylcarbamoyl adenosine modification protein YeaZ
MKWSGGLRMKILALEFSSPQRRVAVLNADTHGKVLAASEVVDASPGRTSKPLAMTEQALQQTGLQREQIECIAVGLGPGSYTGIRAAISLGQGWQLARGLKLIGISSVECIVAQAQADGLVGEYSVVIDAQREEFYLADWDVRPETTREAGPLRLASRAEIREREQSGGNLIGPEVTRWFPSGRIVFPSATVLAQLALRRTDFVSGEKLTPIYLRETNFIKAPPPRQIS